jgi:hypothetical protein
LNSHSPVSRLQAIATSTAAIGDDHRPQIVGEVRKACRMGQIALERSLASAARTRFTCHTVRQYRAAHRVTGVCPGSGAHQLSSPLTLLQSPPPIERDFVDRPGAFPFVHCRMVMPGRVEMGAIVGRELYAFDRPSLPLRQVFLLETPKERQDLRQTLLVIDILDLGAEPRRIGRDVVLQRRGNVKQSAAYPFPPRFSINRARGRDATRAASRRIIDSRLHSVSSPRRLGQARRRRPALWPKIRGTPIRRRRR